MNRNENRKGFTLIEMLVVIAIIAILVAIIIPTVSNATEKAKQATDLANVRSMVAQYQIDLLNGDTTKSAAALTNFTKKSDKAVYVKPTFATDGSGTVSYIATLLQDGNGTSVPTGAPTGPTAKNVYTWTLGALVTETSAASGG